MNRAAQHRPDYQVYLLRLWRESTQTPWRATVQSASTQAMYHFATVEALFAFLEGRLNEPTDDAHARCSHLAAIRKVDRG